MLMERKTMMQPQQRGRRRTVTDKLQEYVDRAVQSNLIMLNLFNRDVGIDGARIIAAALESDMNNVQSLDLGRTLLNLPSLQVLAASLVHDNCKVTLLEYVHVDPREQRLDLTHQDIHNRLSNNQLENPAVELLCSMVLCHPGNKIEVLGLGGNEISDSGLVCLAQALNHVNCKVRRISLLNNPFTPVSCAANWIPLLKYHVRAARRLKSVDLFSCLPRNTGSPRGVSELSLTEQLQTELDQLIKFNRSEWAKKVITILSVRAVPRISIHVTGFRHIPVELIRKIAAVLPRN